VDRFLAEVEQARGLARGMGVRGVPTIELPGLRIEGFEGERPLRDVLDRIAEIQD
jgi:predicted DsbA family dithiol-disulfide isomerase